MTPAVPLMVLGLADAMFSGFRAYAGHDARVRKHRAPARAALRGLTVGGLLLLAPVLAVAVLLLTTSDRARTYALTAGGQGYLFPLAVYAAAVLLGLAVYFVLPFRAGTFAMVICLCPLTLLRPLAVAAACLGSLVNGGGTHALLVGVIAGAAVLCVEPVVRRRWYGQVVAVGLQR